MSDLWHSILETAPFSFLLLMLAPLTHLGSLAAVVVGWMGRRRAGFVIAAITLAGCFIHVLFGAGGALFVYLRGSSAIDAGRSVGLDADAQELRQALGATVQDYLLLGLCTLIVPVIVSVFALGLRSTEGQRV